MDDGIVVFTDEEMAAKPKWVPQERLAELQEQYNELWLALFQIGDEADSWLRFGGDPRIVLEHIRDVATLPDDGPVYAIRDKETP